MIQSQPVPFLLHNFLPRPFPFHHLDLLFFISPLFALASAVCHSTLLALFSLFLVFLFPLIDTHIHV